MATTSAADVQALDQIRGRLQQLANSLSSLKRDIEISDPLPSWPTIQSSAQLIFNQLDKLTPLLDDHRAFLSTAHTFPLPSFPRPAQEVVLGQLLRKKLEPAVEDWIDEGASVWARLEQGSSLDSADREGDGIRELWDWAATKTLDLSSTIPWGLDYTTEELKREGGAASVVTGLKRELNDGNDEESDEDEDEDEDEHTQEQADNDTSMVDAGAPAAEQKSAVPPLTIEEMLKFVNTGAPPPPT